ncbi:hypothetical protein FB451DRAFT_159393 [Mycena latifolia]|nr:hypothetical protein FB451DRAFT_159393 [Mycena latifolia]
MKPSRCRDSIHPSASHLPAMLSVLSAFLLLASTALSSPTARRTSLSSKRGLSDVSYQGSGPRPWTNGKFDARSPQAQNDQWFHLVDGGEGVGVSPGTQVGWRLKDDPTTEIVFYMTESPLFLIASYNGSDANKPDIQSFATVGEANFPTSSNNTATIPSVDDNIWTNSTGGAVVPWQYGIGVTNGCDDDRIMVITTIDANGTAKTISGRGERDVDFASLPMNVTIYFQDSPEDVTSISYFATDALTYKVGAGSNQPTVPPATFGTGISWCDID